MAFQQIKDKIEELDQNQIEPIRQMFPPNQIISPKYAPDQTVQTKLLLRRDQRRYNTQFIPPKLPSPDLQKYVSNFTFTDTLGKKYSQKINQLVYLKFNNTKNNKRMEIKSYGRIMSAFYMPFKYIYSNQNINILQNVGLSKLDTYKNFTSPNVKMNRGCSFDPLFASAYQSGNLFAAIRRSPFQYDLILQNDINNVQEISWFNFTTQFQQIGYYTFRIVNITKDLRYIFNKGYQIGCLNLNVFKPKEIKQSGYGWSSSVQCIKFSESDLKIENSQKKYFQLYFQFKCKNKKDVVQFSLHVPYGSLQSQKLFQKILYKKLKNMINIQKIQYGRTISGNSLYAFMIKKKIIRQNQDMTQISPKNQSFYLRNTKQYQYPQLIKDSKRKSIVVLGRWQGRDTNSSFAIQGMIESLLQSIETDPIKRQFVFYFIPIVNVDAVKYGNNLTNVTGSNLLNYIRYPHKIYQAQVFYLKSFLNKINKQNQLSLILSLTSNYQSLRTHIQGSKVQGQEAQDSRIFPFILSKRHKSIQYQKCQFYQKKQNDSLCCVLSQLYPKAYIYHIKISLFQCSKKFFQLQCQIDDNDFKQSSPQSQKTFGKQIFSYYLQHIKFFDRNYLVRDRWLRQILEVQMKMSNIKRQSNHIFNVQQIFPKQFYELNSQNINIKTQVQFPIICFDNNQKAKTIKINSFNQYKHRKSAGLLQTYSSQKSKNKINLQKEFKKSKNKIQSYEDSIVQQRQILPTFSKKTSIQQEKSILKMTKQDQNNLLRRQLKRKSKQFFIKKDKYNNKFEKQNSITDVRSFKRKTIQPAQLASRLLNA